MHGFYLHGWFFFSSGIGPCSRSFQRLTSHVIAFHYLRCINVIQFACCCGLENRYLQHCAKQFKRAQQLRLVSAICYILCNKGNIKVTCFYYLQHRATHFCVNCLNNTQGLNLGVYSIFNIACDTFSLS